MDADAVRTEDLEPELAVALAAAAEAAEILLRRAGADRVREKARADLVTAVDEEAERAIQAAIHRAFPDDLFVAEEFSGEAAGEGRCWIVDPIDGTTNFVHGHPFSCVSIAFVDGEGPAVGVIHAPFLGEVYHAARGSGSFLNDRRIRVSETDVPAASLVATGFPFKSGKGDSGAYFDLVEEMVLTTHGVRRAGAAALDLAYVACGRVDAYFEIGLSPWDVAAGVVLVEQAGGRVTGWRGDLSPPLRTGRIIASNGRVHEWLVEATGRFVPPL
ncbi:MAG TPA: inositol monophosphatase family protein [Longimicrobiaceae bacterium]|nr:inositol monophosphatase family protein [Longimicrobiaceae bacterium]